MAVQSTDINFRYFMFSKEDYDKKTEIEKKVRFFSTSYRAPIITGRAAKRFGRLMRAGKVKENIGEYIKNYPLDAKAKGLI